MTSVRDYAQRYTQCSAVVLAIIGLVPAMSAAGTRAERAGSTSNCGSATTGTSSQSIDVQGSSRQYRVAVPDSAAGSRSRGLILNFHGAGSSDVAQGIYSQLDEKGPARGFVVITPNAGSPAIWDSRKPEPGATYFEATDANLAFTTALMNRAEAEFCVDPRRVYATGFSNGAGMAVYLACQLRPRIAAVAPVAGINIAKPCPHGEPISVISFHGTDDQSVGYQGGPGAIQGRPNIRQSVPAAIRAWARRAGCRSKPASTAISAEIERIRYRSCDRGVAVELYTVHGGGHTWPGSLEIEGMGYVTQDISAADTIVDFFSSHR